MSRHVAAFLFVSSLLASLASASVVLGPEQALPLPGNGPATGRQNAAAVASDGSDFLVLWADESGGREGLYASIVTGAGMVSDVPPRRIGPRALVRNASACWTGSSYLVVWTADGQGILTTSLRADGQVRVPPHVLQATSFTFNAALAWNGRRAMLVASGSDSRLRALLLDADGAPIGAAVTIEPPIVTSFGRLASDGADFAIFSFLGSSGGVIPATTPPPPGPSQWALVMTRLSGSGNVIDASPVPLATLPGPGDFGVTGHAGSYGLAYLQGTGIDTGTMKRFRIDAATAAVSELPAVAAPPWSPDVVWTGGDYAAVWLAYSTSTAFTLKFNQFSSTDVRTVLASNSAGAVWPHAACGGGKCVVAWMGGPGDTLRFGGGNAEAAIMTADGVLMPAPEPLTVGIAPMAQLNVDLATSGHQTLAIWLEQIDDFSADLRAARLTPAGEVIDRTPMTIGTKLDPSTDPHVVSIGDRYVVVWTASGAAEPGTWIRSIGLDGQMSPAARLPLTPIVSSLASNGSMALLSYKTDPGIAALRIDASGSVDSVPITITSRLAGYAAISASNGTDFLVGWSEGSDYWQFPSPDMLDVYASRVFAPGVADAAATGVAAGPKNQFPLAMGSNGRDYLVVIRLQESLAVKKVLREGQVAGSPADDGTILGFCSYCTSAIGRLGSGYAIAWDSPDSNYQDSTLRVLVTDDGGQPVPGPDLVAARSTGYEPRFSPAMTSFGSVVQLGYSRFSEEDNSLRAFVRTLAGTPARRQSVRHR